MTMMKPCITIKSTSVGADGEPIKKWEIYADKNLSEQEVINWLENAVYILKKNAKKVHTLR